VFAQFNLKTRIELADHFQLVFLDRFAGLTSGLLFATTFR